MLVMGFDSRRPLRFVPDPRLANFGFLFCLLPYDAVYWPVVAYITVFFLLRECHRPELCWFDQLGEALSFHPNFWSGSSVAVGWPRPTGRVGATTDPARRSGASAGRRGSA